MNLAKKRQEELQVLAKQAIADVEQIYLGNRRAVALSFTALFSRGHLLIEDVPGIGKTTLALAIAQSSQLMFRRVQMTADLLPADLIGVSIFNPQQQQFQFHPGPIFSQVLLVDELNRATPKTQSALLEAMAEAAVSVDGVRHTLELPFIVLATQNPTEQAGTFVLPESQLDRFLMRISLGYPTAQAESSMIMQGDLKQVHRKQIPTLSAIDVLTIQEQVDQIVIHDVVAQYILALVQATRAHESIELGISPRGSLALAQAARAHAWLAGRTFVTPDDVYELVQPVFAHRLMPRKTGLMEKHQLANLQQHCLDDVLSQVPAPV